MDRSTRQRHAIQLVFKAADRPLNIRDVHDAGRKILPALGIATVYRAVRDLLDEGWLAPVEIPGEPPYYEAAGKTHHHHFRCRKCDRLFELQGCVSDLVELLPPGFRLEAHDIVVYGACVNCARTRTQRH